ncbi:MAG: HNH endonuclease, partial [Nitrososphaera sp.]
MPPRNVRTIRDLIYWEYAKLIAGSAVGDRKNYGFIMHTYNNLKTKKLHPSTILRENQKLVKEASNICSYCGFNQDLQWEHIIPKSRGGPDTIDNMVL